MASNLATIHGTEKDRVNCPFFFKVGVCRHGDRCSRLHTRPTESQTLLLANMYQSPGSHIQADPRVLREHFEDFYEDVYEELNKHGKILELHVCENLADHMIGNVYVKFREAEHAAAARTALRGRFYAQQPIIVDFSPMTDFREASCRQYEEGSCQKGGYCNFLHLKRIPRELRRKVFDYCSRGRRYEDDRSDRKRRRHRSPSTRGRGSSAERRAKIEQWNCEREEQHLTMNKVVRDPCSAV